METLKPTQGLHVVCTFARSTAEALPLHFQALGDLAAQKIDFFGLQETRMSPHQAAAWQREAMRLGYRAWVHPGYRATDSMERTYYHHGLGSGGKGQSPCCRESSCR